MDETSGFIELEHTADWALRVWGKDLNELMVSAVKGMYTLSSMVFSKDVPKKVHFSIQAFDEGSLVVEFLNEVLFYAESESLLLDELDLQMDGNNNS